MTRTTNAAHLREMQALRMRASYAPHNRGDAIAALTRRIDHHYWPRWTAFWIACITALFGVLFSAILWRVGMEAMTWRYPVSVLLSYLVLLALLDSWSRRRWDDWLQWDGSPSHSSSNGSSGGHCNGSTSYSGEGGNFGGAGASDSFDTGGLDVGSTAGDALGAGFEVAASAEEGAVIAVPLLLIFALLLLFGGFAFGLIGLIWNAPTLLAHLMLDAGTASMLYVYARPQQRNSWFATAL
ncbi:MAG: hypothetical protein ACRCWJ_22225, partial [Casimicrobium sp.]